jgi:hypothetical protein
MTRITRAGYPRPRRVYQRGWIERLCDIALACMIGMFIGGCVPDYRWVS